MEDRIIVQWPESQSLMEFEGFEDNCELINEESLLIEYGSSAYYVDRQWWIKNILNDNWD